MIKEFSIGLRQNEEWSLAVAMSMSLEGMGAGLYTCGSMIGSDPAALTGLVMVLLGAMLLLVDLGHPLRFWRVAAKAPSAWISLGALFITGQLLFGAAALAVGADHVLRPIFLLLSWLASLMLILYPGQMLGAVPAVPWWQKANLPTSFLFHSLASGLALASAISLFTTSDPGVPVKVLGALLTLLFMGLFTIWTQIRPQAGVPAVGESLRMLKQGDQKRWFIFGGIWVGLILPLILVGVLYLFRLTGPAALVLLPAACLLRLAGDVSYRYAVLKAGVWQPLI